MTLEEKANRFREDLVCSTTRYVGQENYGYIEQAYLAGAEENGVVWHDLRKDPFDTPMIGIRYLVSNKYGATLIGYWNGKYFVSADEDTVEIASPIAWCEIPTFDKE